MQSPVIDVVVSDTPPEDRDAVLAVLRTYNQAQTGRVRAADFAVLLRDPETEAVIGGLYGEESYGWGFIKYLVVPENLRGLSLGSRLIKEAEEIARRRGFVGVWLDTYDFQARPFYEKLGYEVFGELEGGDGARGQFFLKKRFS
ncbi:GNAT family N-acetyltransferase [Ciceribacter thiooxidans]|uniref:GNAT family N-acetyltransferase n=1 Tax=Ciceribacter thiooxidans TaxID=1969821 RepID=A0ABV7HZK5_9HYPH|nr:GNAT family N-acetyltransferase [Ciceribacter thiooxidans]